MFNFIKKVWNKLTKIQIVIGIAVLLCIAGYVPSQLYNNQTNVTLTGTFINPQKGIYTPDGKFHSFPLRVIWDDETYAGDADVYGTEALLAGLQQKGLITLDVVTSVLGNYNLNNFFPTAVCAEPIFNYYGIHPLYGKGTNNITFEPYAGAPAINYYHFYTAYGIGFTNVLPSAVSQWRYDIMKDTNNPPFIIITTSFFNYNDFLLCGSDNISSLTGAQMEANGLIAEVVMGGGFWPATTSATGVENNYHATAPAFMQNILNNMSTNCVHIFVPLNSVQYNANLLSQEWLNYLSPDNPVYFGWTNFNDGNGGTFTSGGHDAEDGMAVLSIFGTNLCNINLFQFIQASNWVYTTVDSSLNYGSNIFITNGITYPWYVLYTNVAPWTVISNFANTVATIPPPQYSRAAEQPNNSDADVSLNANMFSANEIIGNAINPVLNLQVGGFGIDSQAWSVYNLDTDEADSGMDENGILWFNSQDTFMAGLVETNGNNNNLAWTLNQYGLLLTSGTSMVISNGSTGIYNLQIQSFNGTITLSLTNSLFIETATTNTTVTLPTASGHAGKSFTIKRAGATGTVTISAGQNIDSTNIQALSQQYEAIEVISDGTQWWIKNQFQ